jgi:hypothetical protein
MEEWEKSGSSRSSNLGARDEGEGREARNRLTTEDTEEAQRTQRMPEHNHR